MKLPGDDFNRMLQELKPVVCIHCAGSSSVGDSVKDPRADYQANTLLTSSLLDAAAAHAPGCRFVFYSSAAVYGNPARLPVTEDQPPAPLSPYGLHKLQCERRLAQIHREHGLPTASLRIFSAFGPGLKRQVVWDMCRKILCSDTLRLFGTGSESRDFIHAADVASAAVLVAESAPMRGEHYNVALGRETTISGLAGIMTRALGFTGAVEFDGQVPPGTPLNWRADISRLCDLGFKPQVELEQGLAATADWCRRRLEAEL